MKLQGAIFDTRDTLLDETGSPLPGLMPFLSWMKMEGVWMYALCDGNMNETRQALEQAAPKDYSDIRKYLRDVSTAGRLPFRSVRSTLLPKR